MDGSRITSTWQVNAYGISQGLLLRLLLFLLYINHIPGVVNGLVVLFAHDTSCTVRGQTDGELKEKLETDLRSLDKWFQENNLTLNPIKTNIPPLGLLTENLNIKHNNDILTSVNRSRFLGVTIDSCLSWEFYIQNLARIISDLRHSLREQCKCKDSAKRQFRLCSILSQL